MILLKLQQMKKIQIIDKKIQIINNDTSDLKKTEKYIMQNISNGKVISFVNGDTYSYTKEDAIDDNLIKKRNFNKKKNHILAAVIIFVLASFSLALADTVPESSILYTISIILFILLLFIVPLYFISFEFSYTPIEYERTELGKDINQKLNGLKNYIKDFSNLKDADTDALVLWEDYLIYSVMFNINKDIYDEFVQLINVYI